jgi:sugar phosphate isomerase/epimerase
VEFDHRWLAPMTDDDLRRLRQRTSGLVPVCSFWLSQTPGETLADAVRCAGALGATVIRLHLTPVLAGARAAHGARWDEWVSHARPPSYARHRALHGRASRFALENHQDFGSEELVSMAEAAGDNVGITLDTGNPFAVGEDPVAFTRRAAHRVRHVHFKDYNAQFTDEGLQARPLRDWRRLRALR